MDKRREGKQIIPAKKSAKQPTSEGLTEEQMIERTAEFLYECNRGIWARKNHIWWVDAKPAVKDKYYKQARELRTLHWSSPQEVKEQVKQVRGEMAEWGNERCKNEKHIAERHGMKISMSYPRKRECFVCWQLLLEKEG